uniref:Uncharacterized protein n=1 Tax=Anguilla anguilla TaxID=7936 RepID=A0A0E9VIL1_ANGAN
MSQIIVSVLISWAN